MNKDEALIAATLGFDATRLSPTYKTVTGSNPAANTEVTFGTVPTGKYWRLLCATVSLAQGATQTPLPSLKITDGTNTLAMFPGASAAVSASTTTQLTWAVGLTVITAGAALVNNMAPLPNPGLLLPAGYVVSTSTNGIDANTDYAAGTLYVIEWS